MGDIIRGDGSIAHVGVDLRAAVPGDLHAQAQKLGHAIKRIIVACCP